MEEIGTTNPEYQPLRVKLKWRPFKRPHSKTIPLASIHLFSKQMVPSLCPESLTQHSLRLFSPVLCVCLIKGFLPSITFLRARRFFFYFFCFIFIAHFLWACGSLCEPQKFSSFCLFTCLSNNSTDFSQTCVSTSPIPMHALPVILFSA